MVCALGSGRMAALARLLTPGNISKSIADDFGHQKLAAQYIHRELHEANEANLIDEKDMHIFDLRPMTDPLHLVSCNACRKPIKASQYAFHAELCTSLTSLEEIGFELHGNTGHKKPPRKDRRKLPTVHSNQATSVGERDKFEHLDANDISASESHLETPSAEAQRISPGNTNSLGTAIPRPRKRSKMVTAEGPAPILDHFEVASGVISGETIAPKSDVPVPLATKIYYSQRDNHLRSVLSHLYHNKRTKECSGGCVNEKVFQANVVTELTSSPNSFSLDEISDDQLDKEGDHPMSAAHNPDQILGRSSELYLRRSGGFPPAKSISNQFSVNNVLRPHTSLGKMSSYFTNSYSFADSSVVHRFFIS